MKSIALLLLISFSGFAQVSHGRLERIEDFKSTHVSTRHVEIWLPDGYGVDPKKKYPVLYMHDGQNLFQASTSFNGQEWGVDETLHGLMHKKDIQECIVVGIWNTGKRFAEYFPAKAFPFLSDEAKKEFTKISGEPLSDEYLKFIVTELKPYIDKTFHTKPDRDHTYMAGSSMGGLISLYAVLEYPNVFSKVACLSTHWLGTLDLKQKEVPMVLEKYVKEHLPKFNHTYIYFDYGTSGLDAYYEKHQKVVDQIMAERGYPKEHWITRKFEGAEHHEADWRARFEIPAKFLLKR
ncbi:hypothetical protein SanaruYs_32210 [Chryseotalea sanaruensis]|uniref:Esterase n=1 Tax=Chryseotalea sanaruensis TaxID=2482724 RepID=A0A401UDN2_9BACT|nr:alpha/beta hydrolase-fold protein [Chryseotalea sanaruensis]GCC52980.1 hypothetical protein SanaruYs_32210 [Chryseotalea sanaruensis]